ncbi:ABC transporter permease [Nibribacter koreensis]|uniref:Transport permease protein n=1 Tax=Nibribacter koreensis TaxID=1084519 RepID=A0ABP8F5I0_9BACT
MLSKIEFKLRYYENKLGLFWALIKPLMDITIYYIVFNVILKQNIPAFASYLFIGLILFNFFIESTSGTISILHSKKYLYEYSNMNKLEIYLSTLLSNVIGFSFNLIMFLVFYVFIEPESIGLNINNFYIIPLFVNLFITALGVSLMLSSIFVLAKDITQIWQVFATVLMFISPLFYKLSSFKEALPSFDYVNPIAGIIINARRVMMQGLPPDFDLMIFDYGYGFLFLFIGLIMLNKIGSKAAEKL